MINKKAWYNNIERYLLLVLMLVTTTILFVNIIFRYCFSYSFSWAEQAARYLIVWASFVGISWAGSLDVHMKVTALSLVLKKHPERFEYVMVIGDIITVVFAVFMAYQIGLVTNTIRMQGQYLVTIPWVPKWTQYLAGCVGMLGLAVRIVQRRTVWFIKRREMKTENAVGREDEET